MGIKSQVLMMNQNGLSYSAANFWSCKCFVESNVISKLLFDCVDHRSCLAHIATFPIKALVPSFIPTFQVSLSCLTFAVIMFDNKEGKLLFIPHSSFCLEYFGLPFQALKLLNQKIFSWPYAFYNWLSLIFRLLLLTKPRSIFLEAVVEFWRILLIEQNCLSLHFSFLFSGVS